MAYVKRNYENILRIAKIYFRIFLNKDDVRYYPTKSKFDWKLSCFDTTSLGPPEYILGQFRLKIFPRPKCYAKHIFVYFSYGSILPDRPAKTQNLNSFELSQFYPT